MRALKRVLFIALTGLFAVAGCDCESMLATKRKDGAPTSSEGPAVEFQRASVERPPEAERFPTAKRPSTAEAAPTAERASRPTTIYRPTPKSDAGADSGGAADESARPRAKPSSGALRATPFARPERGRLLPRSIMRGVRGEPGGDVDGESEEAYEIQVER